MLSQPVFLRLFIIIHPNLLIIAVSFALKGDFAAIYTFIRLRRMLKIYRKEIVFSRSLLKTRWKMWKTPITPCLIILSNNYYSTHCLHTGSHAYTLYTSNEKPERTRRNIHALRSGFIRYLPRDRGRLTARNWSKAPRSLCSSIRRQYDPFAPWAAVCR